MGDLKADNTMAALNPFLSTDEKAPISRESNGDIEPEPVSSVIENSNPFTEEDSFDDMFLLFDPSSTKAAINEHEPRISDYIGNALLDLESTKTSQSPRVYVAPRAMITHQDSFSESCIALESPGATVEDSMSEGTQELALPRLRVADSPRAFVYARAIGSSSPRVFGSPRAIGSPRTPKGGVGLIDTAAPFESVKEAVSKFGGITDWKAHKMQTVERHKVVEQELENIQEEISQYKKEAETAEEEKQKVIKELETTKRLVEELKLNLEKAETEEEQAKQDSELAKLRVEEMEQGIADDASVAAKAQLEVAKARHLNAVSELKSVKEELETMREEYDVLLREKDLAVKKAEEAALESKEVEKKLEDLTIELIATKELLESAHTAHLEAEEQRFCTAMARDQDVYNWEKELKMVEEEIEILNQKIVSANDVKHKLEAASALLLDLTAELAAYRESSKSSEGNLNGEFPVEKRNHKDIQAAVASARKELEVVKLNIEKANAEVSSLRVVVASLQLELEKEKSDLAETKQRIEESSVTETSREMPKRLQEAAREADKAKLLAETAREEQRKAKEEAEEKKAALSTIESKLIAAKKQMEAARASEKLALAAIKALQESETQKPDDISSPRSVMLSLEEYYELCKRAHEAEERANVQLAAAVSRIEAAREEEYRSLERLEEVNREMIVRKEELKIAMEKAEKARGGKMGMEQELRQWRSENEQQRKKAGMDSTKSPRRSIEGQQEMNGFNRTTEDDAPFGYSAQYGGNSSSMAEANNMTPDGKKKKKKLSSILPKVFMFLSWKRSHK